MFPVAKYRLSIIDTSKRPYLRWLADGTKTAEGRINTNERQRMQVGDTLLLFDKKTAKYVFGPIAFKHEYNSFEAMLIGEGVHNMLPFLSDKDLAKGISVYSQFPGAERVKLFGCVAIGIDVREARV